MGKENLLGQLPGFLKILPFLAETTTEKTIVISLWAEKRDTELYKQYLYLKVTRIVSPYLITAITFKHYTVETSLCPTLRGIRRLRVSSKCLEELEHKLPLFVS